MNETSLKQATGKERITRGRRNFVFGWSKLHFTVSFASCQSDFKGLPDTKEERKEAKERGRKSEQQPVPLKSNRPLWFGSGWCIDANYSRMHHLSSSSLSLESENLLHRLSSLSLSLSLSPSLSPFLCFPESICLPLPQTRHLQDLPFVLIFVLSRHGHQSFLVLFAFSDCLERMNWNEWRKAERHRERRARKETTNYNWERET